MGDGRARNLSERADERTKAAADDDVTETRRADCRTDRRTCEEIQFPPSFFTPLNQSVRARKDKSTSNRKLALLLMAFDSSSILYFRERQLGAFTVVVRLSVWDIYGAMCQQMPRFHTIPSVPPSNEFSV